MSFEGSILRWMDTDGVIMARCRSSDEMMDVIFRQM